MLGKSPGSNLVIGLFGGWGVGISLMAANYLNLGAILCAGASLATLWRFKEKRSEILNIRSDTNVALFIIIFVVEISFPSYIYYDTIHNSVSYKVSMADQWIYLASDIKDDLPLLEMKFDPPSFSPDMTDDTKRRIFKEQGNKEVDDFKRNMDRMKNKYGARLILAESEMQELGIDFKTPDRRPLSQEYFLPKTLILPREWEFWANKLNAEGHKLLVRLGKDHK